MKLFSRLERDPGTQHLPPSQAPMATDQDLVSRYQPLSESAPLG
jgi:hypothetical protein